MKRLFLSLAFLGTLGLSITACNSSKNMAGTADSTKVDSTMTTPMDTTQTPAPPDTTTMPPDTTKMPPR
ncbi:coproporphyrinogen III oxidase [Pedobacter sp. MW01-1-1]|uniref:coproporphyrinogen III oxidase n=1 Tax=Pedobacter sp. MW01-1-1 TaxID=3383027 RepID=UPI003FEE4010